MLNTKKMQWLGPADNSAFAEDFQKRFYRPTVLTGHAFLQASDAERHKEYAQIMMGRNFNVESSRHISRMSEADLRAMLFPPGAASALGDFARHAACTPKHSLTKCRILRRH